MANNTTTNCGYQGYEFGANYLDSICCDGYLWDADSGCGEYLDNGGDIPCPSCNRAAWLAYYRSEIIECGFEESERLRGPRIVKYGGYPEVIWADPVAMKTIRRWLKRGWYRGRKFDVKELRHELCWRTMIEKSPRHSADEKRDEDGEKS